MFKVDLRNLCLLAYGNGMTQWGYKAPHRHNSGVLANPDYWADGPSHLASGDWLFVTHLTPSGTYNAIYCFTRGPLGLWAQQLVSSSPPIHS